MSDYTYWQNALIGHFGPVHDGDPQPGFYRKKNKGSVDQAISIWLENGDLFAASGNQWLDPDDIWSWCCRTPITEELYRAISEKGQSWPDAIEEMIGSNNPPTDEAAIDEIDSAISAANAELAKPVTDQAGADRLGNHRDRLAKLYKDREAARKTEKQPHMDAAQAVDARFKPILARVEEAGSKIKKAITSWLLIEERRRNEEAVAEMKRQEEQRKAALNANLPLPEPMPVPVVDRPKAGTAGRATALRTYKRAEITDYKAALSHFEGNSEVKELIQTLADRCVRAGVDVPGCKVIEEKRAA